jgi:hypothetical protein
MTISDNQAAATKLVDYHRRKASETIAKIKETKGTHGVLNLPTATRELAAFRKHSKNLFEEIEAMKAELLAADAWVQREFDRCVTHDSQQQEA